LLFYYFYIKLENVKDFSVKNVGGAMKRFDKWLIKRIVRKNIRQNYYHDFEITEIYDSIFESCRSEFREKNTDLKIYLKQRFEESLRSIKEASMKKVFLGGTCNNSTWRDQLIPTLKIDYFNPVVKDWNSESQKEELKQRKECDIVLYTITPLMTGVYSIAEVIDDSNKRPKKTVFVVLLKDSGKIFNEGQAKSLSMVGKMVENNGGKTFLFKEFGDKQIEILSKYLNNF
jgi:hypothetical protein